MRRRSTRAAATSSPDRSKTESPKKSRGRHSKRRKRSSSRSDAESDNETQKKVVESQIDNNSANENEVKPQEDQEPVLEPESATKRRRRSRSNDSNVEPERKSRRGKTRVSPIREDQPEVQQDEKKGKGKSKSKHKTNIEKSETSEYEIQTNSEIYENVQVTPQSPTNTNPVDNENVDETKIHVQNINECQNEETEHGQEAVQENGSTHEEITTGEVQDMENLTEYCVNEENNQASSLPNEESVNNEQNNQISEENNQVSEENNQISEQNSEITEPGEWVSGYENPSETTQLPSNEEKPEKKKKIIRLTRNRSRHDSVLSEGEIKDTSASENNDDTPVKRKRNSSIYETRRRKSPSPEIIIRGPRKRNVSTKDEEHKPVEAEPKPKKPTKKIKLIRRDFSEKPQEEKIESEAPEQENEEPVIAPVIKPKWTSTNFINNVPDPWVLNLETLKNVLPKVEFLNEDEVVLEPIRRNSFIPEEAKNERRASSSSEGQEYNSSEEVQVVDKNIIAMNRKISIVDDTASKLKPPPSPAQNPVSNVLYITNLVRPFTVKALKELLERTGKIVDDGFWTDKIKSKCMVEYENAEDAEATRNALHGVHWPIGNGKKLQIEYSTKEEMEKMVNPPIPIIPVVPEKVIEKEIKEEKPLDRSRDMSRERSRGRDRDREEKKGRSGDRGRDWDLGKENVRRGRSRSRSRERARKHSRRSATPDDYLSGRKHKKVEEPVPQKLMDDLFLKTKSTPSIYWQPLSTQEIYEKEKLRQMRMEEHQRRIEGGGASRAPAGVRNRERGRGTSYRRRYD